MLENRDYMRDNDPEPPRGGGGGGIRLPETGIGWLLLINIAIFLYQQIATADGSLPALTTGTPMLQEGRYWTLITYQFVHGNLLHIAMNLLLIWVAGRPVERTIGGKGVVAIYLLGGLAGALLEMGIKDWLITDGSMVTLIGASGSAFALLAAFGILFPYERLFALLFFIIPVNLLVKNLVLGLIAFELIQAVLDLVGDFPFPISGVAHFAHLGGALLGFLYMRRLGYGRTPMTLEKLRKDRSERERRPPRGRAGDVQRQEPGDFVSEEVDPILDKINEHGFQSLTDEEREVLARAEKEIRRRNQS